MAWIRAAVHDGNLRFGVGAAIFCAAAAARLPCIPNHTLNQINVDLFQNFALSYGRTAHNDFDCATILRGLAQCGQFIMQLFEG